MNRRSFEGRVAELVLYEVTEAELRQLEEGSPVALHLNFGVFLISTCISFIISLLTTTLDDKTYIWFVVVTVATGLLGLVLIGFWMKNRKRLSEVIDTIKQRIPAEGIQLPLSGSVSTTSKFTGTLEKRIEQKS